MINPVFLRTFCTLVEKQHFTRTAEALCITQSGVSQHLKKLEEQLGANLIKRNEKGVQLTVVGQRTYDEAKSIVHNLSTFTETVKADAKYEGTVRFMSPGSVGLSLYPKLLSLQKTHPGLAINYRFAPNQSIIDAIGARAIHCGLVTSAPNKGDLNYTMLTKEKLMLVTAKHTQVNNLEDLQNIGFINHPDGHHHANLLLSKNFKQFVSIGNIKENGFSNQISLILEPVSLGLGFTVLPENAVKSFAKQDKINIHPLEKQVSESIYLVSQSEEMLPKRIQFIMSEVKQYFTRNIATSTDS